MNRSLVALLATVTIAPAAVAQDVGVQIEPSSKVPFPVEITAAGGGDTHVLTGVAIRTKTFLKVKVYAFGIYVDEAPARAALSSFANRSAQDLERNQDFYDRILDRDFAMTLRLVMTRDVGGEDMADAFDGALRPRVLHAASDMNMPGGEAALDTFRGYFSVEEMTKESELLFTCKPDGTLSSLVKGEPADDISSNALCWALFDVFLGEDPISNGGKKTVIANIPNILARGN
ncbi:chalcone isomerase family protein [Gemmatimonadota bacterium]